MVCVCYCFLVPCCFIATTGTVQIDISPACVLIHAQQWCPREVTPTSMGKLALSTVTLALWPRRSLPGRSSGKLAPRAPPISYLEGSVTISGKGKNPLVLGPAQCHSLPSSSHSQPQSWFSDHDFIRLPCTCTHRHQGPRPLISPHPTPIDHHVYKAKITFVFLWVPCNGNLLPPSTDIRSCMWMAPG